MGEQHRSCPANAGKTIRNSRHCALGHCRSAMALPLPRRRAARGASLRRGRRFVAAAWRVARSAEPADPQARSLGCGLRSRQYQLGVRAWQLVRAPYPAADAQAWCHGGTVARVVVVAGAVLAPSARARTGPRANRALQHDLSRATYRGNRNLERRIRRRRSRRSGASRASLKAIPSLNKMQVLELARCEWIEPPRARHRLGPSGIGT